MAIMDIVEICPEFESGMSLNTITQYQELNNENDTFFLLTNQLTELCAESSSDRDNEVFKVDRNSETYEVSVSSDKTLEDYRSLTTPDDWELLIKLSEQLKGNTISFINPTMEGGGVAMLRPPLVHLLKLLEIDAHWYVMEGNEEVFKITKKMHNIMQDRLDSDLYVTEDEYKIYWEWNAENAKVIGENKGVSDADFLFIDDPQPAPLIKLLQPHIKGNPNIIWRDHIHTDHELMSNPVSPQGKLARFLLEDCGINNVDAIICHPVERFILPGTEDITIFAPATTDPFDDLNRELSQEEINEGIEDINLQIKRKNKLLLGESEDRTEDMISEIDVSRPRILLVARFDESKGMDHAMELGALVHERMINEGYVGKDLPQIILVGNGSVDDPSGVPMYEKMLKLRREKYAKIKEDVVVMRLRHNYLAMNALMQRSDAAMVGIQLSEKEGCETRISDEIEHGLPVIAFNNGGMPLQIIEGESGFVLDFSKPDHDLNRGADIIKELLINNESYAKIQKSTIETGKSFNRRNFGTISNVLRILRTMICVNSDLPIDKYWKMDEIINSQIVESLQK